MQDLYVIGIGASAGGVKVLTELFKSLGTYTNASFVVIQHLHTDFINHTAEMLSLCTSMKVVIASHETDFEPNSVYVLPEGKMMTVATGKLILRDRKQTETINHSIDIFFTSLASLKDKAIGIILSGDDGDGAYGLKHIGEQGGITIVQRPDTAEYPGMPNTAIRKDHVQFSITVNQIADMLNEVLKPVL